MSASHCGYSAIKLLLHTDDLIISRKDLFISWTEVNRNCGSVYDIQNRRTVKRKDSQ